MGSTNGTWWVGFGSAMGRVEGGTWEEREAHHLVNDLYLRGCTSVIGCLLGLGFDPQS